MNTYKMTLSDSVDSMTFDLLEVPIVDKDVEGAVDNTTLDGNIFTDYLWLKKNYVQKWSIMCDDEYSRLRRFYTRQFDNASVPTYKLFYGENISQDQAISGDYILVNNPTERNAPITSFDLLGDATQTTYSGKQLYNYTDLRTTGSFLVVGDDGWYTFTADRTNESSGNYYSFSTYNLALDYSTTYAIVTEIASVSITGAANITPADRWGQFETALFYNNPAVGTYVGTRTTKSAWGNTEGLASNIFVGAGSKATIKFRISVIADTSVTPTTFSYEPYVGGTASPNPDYPQEVNTVTGEQTVKIEGKNLWGGLPTTYSITSAGVNFTTRPDGSVSASGTATAVASSCTQTLAQQNGLYVTIPAGTYTLSGTNPDMPLQLFDIYSGAILAYTGHSTFTVDETTTVFIRVRLASGTTVDGTTYIQLELGNSASQFEPYQEQEFEVNLGKNLFDLKGFLDSKSVTYTEASDGTITFANVGALYSEPFQFSQDDITVSVQGIISNLTGANFRVQLINKAGTSVGEINSSTATRESLSACKVRFNWSSSGTFSLKNIQVERGSQPTSYSAYFTPIELAKIGNYQDRIYKNDGKWYIHRAVRHLSLPFADMNNSDNYPGWKPLEVVIEDLGNSLNNPLAEFTTYKTNIAGQNIGIGINTVSPVKLLYLYRASFGNRTQTQLKADYPNLVVELYYGILEANQYDEEITSSELVGQLEAILQAYLYAGTNNISNGAVSPNLAGQMNLGYKLIFSEETVLIEPTAVRLTLTDGGIINICGCRQNVQLTMRETIQ